MMNPTNELPSDIVQHIQSLLNARDAARMATLSKNLYVAWSTRKIVEFDERHFSRADTFWECAKNTLERYQNTGLTIDTFTIRIASYGGSCFDLEEIIRRAARLSTHDITIECMPVSWLLFLPEEVFASKHLVNLTVTGGIYVFGYLESEVYPQTMLQSLNLTPADSISAEEDFMGEFFWRCTSLKKLVCCGRFISFDMAMWGYGYHCLESLTLDDLHSKDVFFFEDMCRLFPCLKNLCIRGVYNCHDIHISSRSLERISIYADAIAINAVFVVPNIRRFSLEAAASSCVKFEQSSKEWIADLTVTCYYNHHAWRAYLRRLLQSLLGSKISICINVDECYQMIPGEFGFEGSTPDIDHLDIISDVMCRGLVDGLCKVCRPIAICIHEPSHTGL